MNVIVQDSYESVNEITRVTSELLDLPENYGYNLTNTILTRPKSCYGNVIVPNNISDFQVLNALQYANEEDIRFDTLITRFALDFVWFESEQRQVMLWGETQEKVNEAIRVINTWFSFIESGFY